MAASTYLGKSVDDLQSNITITETDGVKTVNGTLHYVTGFDGLEAGSTNEEGTYLAFDIDLTGTGYTDFNVSYPATAGYLYRNSVDGNVHHYLFRIEDSNDHITIEAYGDGVTEADYILSFAGLTLEQRATVDVTTTPYTGTTLIYIGDNYYQVADMQSDIVIDDTNNTITGTVKWVSDQSRNVLALTSTWMPRRAVVTATIGYTGSTNEPFDLTRGGEWHVDLTDIKTQENLTLTISGTNDGSTSFSKVYDISGLTIENS